MSEPCVTTGLVCKKSIMSILAVSLADVGRANAPSDSPHMWGGWAERVAAQGGHQRPEYTRSTPLLFSPPYKPKYNEYTRGVVGRRGPCQRPEGQPTHVGRLCGARGGPGRPPTVV